MYIHASLVSVMATYVDVHDDGENRLEGDRGTPLDITACIVKSKSDPITTHDTLVVSLVRCGELTKPIRVPDKMTSGPR